jgi:mannose-6-phosphate isomerase-like protein (cupin superfamily)
MLALFARPPEELDVQYEGVKRHVPPPVPRSADTIPSFLAFCPSRCIMSSTAIAPSNVPEPVAGVRYVFLRTGEQTGGTHEVIEAFVPPGDEGPPVLTHVHQEKLFLVVEGQVELSVGCERIPVAADGTAYAPRGISPRFVNVGRTPARVIIAARPAFCPRRGEPNPSCVTEKNAGSSPVTSSASSA